VTAGVGGGGGGGVEFSDAGEEGGTGTDSIAFGHFFNAPRQLSKIPASELERAGGGEGNWLIDRPKDAFRQQRHTLSGAPF
jgi:hypothetical protein